MVILVNIISLLFLKVLFVELLLSGCYFDIT